MQKLYSAIIVSVFVFFGSSLYAQDAGSRQLLDLIKKNAVQLNISPGDARDVMISHSFIDSKTNIQYAYLQQMYQGIKVYNSIMTVIFRNNEVLYSSGKFVEDLQKKAGGGPVLPNVQAEQAITKAAMQLTLPVPLGLKSIEERFTAEKKMSFSGAGIAKEKIETELFWWAADDASSVRLVWNVNIDEKRSSDWWNVRIDAMTGTFIEKDNLTVYEKIDVESDAAAVDKNNTWTKWGPDVVGQVTLADISNRTYTQQYAPPTVTSAGYFVSRWPTESPRHAAMATETSPWLRAGAGNAATTNGWHFDGVTNYNITRGNNVHAYLDLGDPANQPAPANPNNIPATSSTPDPTLTFNTIPDLTLQPSNANNRLAAVTNLFYWNNTIHDVLYQYGFDERSGNFQADNMGRGGNGNDHVQAEAQDASGTSNANFATPADGTMPRMQMFLWAGVPTFKVNTPAVVAGNYFASESAFSTNNKLVNVGPKTAQVVYYNDDGVGAGTHFACNGSTPGPLTGKIAMIIRGGGCVGGFVEKVKNAQLNGAIAVIMVNNVAGFPITMRGTDNTITIPAVMISQADGDLLAAQLANNLNITLAAGIGIDGDFDNGIVVHEYGHGVSNRLTGGATNAACLTNAEQGGEGWSDYLALMLTTDWATASIADGPKARPIGVYAVGQPLMNGTGLRTYPYSTDMNINPHTYTNVANPTYAGEAHYIGEIWCQAIWDMTWFIIQQEGTIDPNLFDGTSTKGNSIALRLVMEGMRLQTCRPGFIDARNAILAADSILYNYRHRCAIWNAFARRGMGLSAVQGSSNSTTDGIAAFDVPSSVQLVKTATALRVNQTEKVDIKLNATCECAVNTNYSLRDTIPVGFTYVSSNNGGTLAGDVLTWPALNFASTQETKTYTVTITPSVTGCAIIENINDNRDGSAVGGFASVIASGTTNWVSSITRSSSPTRSWWAASNNINNRDFSLTSGAAGFTAGALSILSFKHFFITKNTIDGGRVEYSTNGGSVWNDAGPLIIQNGYNNIASVAPWGSGTKIFSGVSYGRGSGVFINSIVNLSSLSGQNVRVRFRARGSNANLGTYEGWFIDDIIQQDGCGGIVKAGLYNASGTRVDSLANPVFITAAVPIAITTQPTSTTVCAGSNATFTAAATPAALPTYQWQRSTDAGATWADILGETSTTLTITGTTVAMNGYQYRVNAYNNSGTTGYVTSNVATLGVNPVPTVNTVSDQVRCPGFATDPVNFTGAVTGTVYNWTNNAASIGLPANGTGNIASFIPVNTGSTTVVATIVVTPTFTNGGTTCTGASTSFSITVNPDPVLTIAADPGTTLCAGDPTRLTVMAATPSSPVVTLYTQGGATGLSPNSQNFEAIFDRFDDQAAEDFTVPASTIWTITRVSAGGFYFNGGGPSASYNVTIYNNDATNKPGTAVATYNDLAYTGGESPVITIPATTLSAGTYWISIQANMDFGIGGQWAWGANGTTDIGFPWVWQNPGGGLASCPVWGNGATTCIAGAARNLLFTLTGTSATIIGPPPAGNTYLWSPAAGLSSTTTNPVAASPAVSTVYTVNVTTAAGCLNSASIAITVNQRPAVTTPPANTVVCEGSAATFTATTSGTGSTVKWQMSTTGTGGPWTDVPNSPPYANVTTDTLTINPVALSMNGNRYRISITGICAPDALSTGGLLNIDAAPVITIIPGSTCGGVAGTNGTMLTASSSTGTGFTWSPAAGLYSDATATVAYVAGTPTATVYAAPTVSTIYTVTATNSATGCIGTKAVTVNYTPVAPILSPASATICAGQIQPLNITSSLAPVTINAASGPITVAVPDGTGAPAISDLTITGVPATAIISEIKITLNMTHTWVGDMDINLRAPNGGILNLVGALNDGIGLNGTDNFISTSFSSLGGATISGAPAPRTNAFAAEARVGYGPIGLEQTVNNWAALVTPTAAAANGVWSLAMGDFGNFDEGTLTSWSIAISYRFPEGGIWSPITGLFTDAAGSIPYTGILATTVYANPAISTTYSVTVSAGACPSPARMVSVTVNDPLVITAQPVNDTTCTNGVATFTVIATGAAPSHHWQESTDQGSTWTNVVNAGIYSGATTATLTISNPPLTLSGALYRDSISTAPCADIMSAFVKLWVNSLPVVAITAAPYTNLLPGLITTLTANSTPAASQYQWYKDGVVVGGNSPSIQVDVDGLGLYTVTVGDLNGCGSSSNSILISDSSSGRVFIYPNPNSGIFQVRYHSGLRNTNLPRGMNIYDDKGARVLMQQYAVNGAYGSMDVDMRKYGTGTYWVEVVDTNGDRLAVGKLIIMR